MILKLIFQIETYKIQGFESFEMAKRINKKESKIFKKLFKRKFKRKFNIYFRYFKGFLLEQPYIW